jgi:hypothetical protein
VRPIRGKIREICALVETLGGCTSRQAADIAPQGISAKTVRTYCSRAVYLGLMRFKDGKYQVMPDWRTMTQNADKPSRTWGEQPLTTSAGIYPKGPLPLTSVWAMGERA